VMVRRLRDAVSPEAQETAQVIFEYSRVLNMSDNFDHQRLALSGRRKNQNTN